MPLIRHDLALSYWQIGLLASVPLISAAHWNCRPGYWPAAAPGASA